MQQFYIQLCEYHLLQNLYTSPEAAIQLICERRHNPSLINRVSEFLEHDILDEFSGVDPVFYLPRHLATPSFETMYAIEFAKSFGLALVIGEDSQGIYVANNELKLPLGKLPIETGQNKNNISIIQNFTVIDFNKAQGKPMCDIITHYGMNLPDFHSHLMRPLIGKGVKTIDEADWIGRNFRGDILEQYKKSLALTCVHAIMLEWYTPSELPFWKNVTKPAFDFVHHHIGVRPLVVELMPPEKDSERNWNAYPCEVYEQLSKLTLENRPDHPSGHPS